MSIWKTDELGKFVTLKRGYDLPQQKELMEQCLFFLHLV